MIQLQLQQYHKYKNEESTLSLSHTKLMKLLFWSEILKLLFFLQVQGMPSERILMSCMYLYNFIQRYFIFLMHSKDQVPPTCFLFLKEYHRYKPKRQNYYERRF